jgi:hypothetical protein
MLEVEGVTVRLLPVNVPIVQLLVPCKVRLPVVVPLGSPVSVIRVVVALKLPSAVAFMVTGII